MDEELLAKRMVANHDSAMVANQGTLRGALAAALDWFGSEMQCCLPVRIEAYDRSSRIATVQPMTKCLTREGGFKTAETFSVQAFQFAANGFVIDLPIAVGDVGWVIASDRYTRNVKETHEVSALEDISTHRYSSGFFIPDYYGVLKNAARTETRSPFAGEDGRLVISTYDGKQKLSVGGSAASAGEGGDGDIRIDSFSDDSHKTTVVIKNGAVTVTTTSLVKVQSPAVTMEGTSGNTAVAITGTLTVTGDITSSGGEVTDKRGVVLGTHTHNYKPGTGSETPSNPPNV